jgi:hypothetical protein
MSDRSVAVAFLLRGGAAGASILTFLFGDFSVCDKNQWRLKQSQFFLHSAYDLHICIIVNESRLRSRVYS